MARPLVVCTGISVWDVILGVDDPPRLGSKQFASSVVESVGGPAATGAATVARLGGRSRFVGRSGADARGDALCRAIAGLGIEVAIDRVDGLTTPLSAIVVDPAGERTIINYTDRALYQTPPPETAMEGADVLLSDVRWPAASVAAARYGRAKGIPVVLDLDTAPQADHAEVEPAIRAASHVIASRPGLAAFTGTSDLAEGLERLGALAGGWVAVTDGSNGVLWRGGHQPAFSVDTVETLGAGDVFHGAFALALAEGRSGDTAARFASAAAALKCARPGGWEAIPARADVQRLMEER